MPNLHNHVWLPLEGRRGQFFSRLVPMCSSSSIERGGVVGVREAFREDMEFKPDPETSREKDVLWEGLARAKE